MSEIEEKPTCANFCSECRRCFQEITRGPVPNILQCGFLGEFDPSGTCSEHGKRNVSFHSSSERPRQDPGPRGFISLARTDEAVTRTDRDVAP